jgi:hypothetical protein
MFNIAPLGLRFTWPVVELDISRRLLCALCFPCPGVHGAEHLKYAVAASSSTQELVAKFARSSFGHFGLVRYGVSYPMRPEQSTMLVVEVAGVDPSLSQELEKVLFGLLKQPANLLVRTFSEI